VVAAETTCTLASDTLAAATEAPTSTVANRPDIRVTLIASLPARLATLALAQARLAPPVWRRSAATASNTAAIASNTAAIGQLPQAAQDHLRGAETARDQIGR
jgi:hypothetical protein